MKKYFLLAVVGLLLLTGCGKNQVVCTISAEENGMKVTESIIGELDGDNKVTKVSMEYEYDDAETVKQLCEIVKISFPEAECSGKKIILPDAAAMLEDEETKLVGLTKEEFITYATSEGEGVTCK